MTTAYLLAVFKIDGAKLEHMSTVIRFEPEPDCGPGTVSFVVLESDGYGTEDARAGVVAIAKSNPRFEWALRSLVQR